MSNNDYSKDHVDVMAELRSHALRLIRRYEVEAESYDHMVRLVARGVINHGTNLAIKANRQSRRVLQRVVEKPPTRSAWWFDTKTLTIRPVEIEKRARREVQKGHKLCCEVRLTKEGTVKLVRVDYLYDNRTEAVKAKARHRWGRGTGQRRCLIDLAPEVQDDFVPTTVSLYRTVGKGAERSAAASLTLQDVLPSEVANDVETLYVTNTFIKDFNKEADPVMREFASCVLGNDRFFLDHLEEKGLDHSCLDNQRLGREACRYLGVKLGDVKEGLRNIPQKVWSSDSIRKQIYAAEQATT